MKLLILTAIIFAVAPSTRTKGEQWPWQVGNEYIYNVDSYTWTKFAQSNSTGNAFKTQLIVRVVASRHLVAKLENPLYAEIHEQPSRDVLPSDLKYQAVQNFDHPFEIYINGGSILALHIPTAFSVSYENLLKALVSGLQVDLSPFRHVDSFPNSYHKGHFQGLFKKMEADVTGDCETFYSVSPLSAEWHHELPDFAEDPIEITKSRNYGSCLKSVGYNFGVPEGAVWKGVAYDYGEKQFIKHTSVSRMLVGKQGTIYKSETTSSVFVNPLLFGDQKAEVYSFVGISLSSVQAEITTEWQKSVNYRKITSLLFTMNDEAFTMTREQNIADAQKLLQEMTVLLQNPYKLPESDFLSKFNLLIHLIETMNSQELAQMTSNMETANLSNEYTTNNMWIIYRDAVAQAGTTVTFKEIKSWILAKKVSSQEATEIINAMVSNLQNPTKEIINELFELAIQPHFKHIIDKSLLKSTILLAATKLIRIDDDDLFIDKKIIPRLSHELEKAIAIRDKSNAQLYIRVLGNLAHTSVLKAFTPYFEGKIAISKYLRIQMVISLKSLAHTRNDYVCAALFSLLRNTAEPYEVRVAAAQNIFLAYPTFEMMQIMAYMSNRDPSLQVRAVLKNGIRFVAKLKDPRFAILAKTAKAALNVISQEKYGYGYSTDSLIDQYTDDEELAHFTELSLIGSEDNILPVYLRGALRLRSSSWSEEDSFSISVSSMKRVMDYIMMTGLKVTPNKTNAKLKFSAKAIAEILNIKREPPQPLEGAVFIENWYQQTFYPFNDLEFFLYILFNDKDVPSRSQVHSTYARQDYTKILRQKQVFITFPIASGMPFVLRYSEPTVYIVRNQFYMSNDTMDSQIYDLQFTYARNLDGRVGFVDTLGKMYFAVGIINKLQINIPLKFHRPSIPGEITYKFEFPNQNVNLIHMSVAPYTIFQKTNSLLTVAEDSNTMVIERHNEDLLSTDFKFGHLTGTVFQFKGHSFSSDYKDPSNLFNSDLLTSVCNLLYQKDVALTKFNLMYLANESQNNDVTYTLFYDKLYNQKQSGDMGSASAMNDVTPNSKDRRAKIVKSVSSGIVSAIVQLVDISAVFNGKQKVEYVLTAAIADSFVDKKLQAALFFHGQEQLNAVFKVVKSKFVPLNFEEALKNKVKVTYAADLKYGSSENVHLEGFGERSKEYTESLRNDPLAKQCLQEISKNNLYQKDCYKMIIKAHAPDYFNTTVIYKELNPAIFNLTYNMYEIFKPFYNWKEDINIFKTTKDGKIEIESQAFYYKKFTNYALKSKYGMLRLMNVEGIISNPYIMAIYAPLSSWERFLNWFTGYQNMPFCTIDGSKIWTFSGRSYDYSLSSSWHVVMVDEINYFGSVPELVILARRPSSKHTEVYISYKTLTGNNTFEIEIKPVAIDVKSNATKICDGPLTMYFDDVAETPILEYYNLVEGVKLFSINNGALRLIYDSLRIVIFTGDHRSSTRGICGQSTMEPRDDYMTPYGLVDNPSYYGASFSLEGQFSDNKTVEMKKKAKLKAYQPVTQYTKIHLSDAEWRNAENEAVDRLLKQWNRNGDVGNLTLESTNE